MYRQIERATRALAIGMAWLGGLALIGIIVLSVISISGRGIQAVGMGMGPVRGDTEWVELGTGFAVFCFLPFCTLMRGHATVDLLQPMFGRTFNLILELTADLIMLALALLVTRQTWLGLFDKLKSHETSYIGRIPLWWGYAGAMVGAVAFCLVAGFCVVRALRAFRPAGARAGA